MEIISDELKRRLEDDRLKRDLAKSKKFPKIRFKILEIIAKFLNIRIIKDTITPRLNMSKRGNPFILKNGKFIRRFPEED